MLSSECAEPMSRVLFPRGLPITPVTIRAIPELLCSSKPPWHELWSHKSESVSATPMARSKPIAPYVGRLSRSQVYAARGLYKGLKKSDKPDTELVPEYLEKSIGGDKNGEKRLVPTTKAPRFYPAEDVRQPKKSRKSPHPPSLRSSITPGTVLILLAGRYRGKRVVFLKQLASGLLLVTGPFKVNGVPLRRVNQAYVIATSTKVNVTGIKVCLLPCSPCLICLNCIVRLTTSWMIPISQRLLPKSYARRKKNSLKMANPSPRNPFPIQELLIKRRSTTLSSQPSRKQTIFPNISRLPGVFRKANSLTSWYFNGWIWREGCRPLGLCSDICRT